MTEDDLISALRHRVQDPGSRTDMAARFPVDIAVPASPEEIEATEASLALCLLDLHRRVLSEVGNGGFGPGDGLIGTPRGRLDEDGRSIVELRAAILGEPGTPLPPLIPLCDWGCGSWSCVDVDSGAVVTVDEFGIFDTGLSLAAWLQSWIDGASLAPNDKVPRTAWVRQVEP